jgi:ribosomal protein S12 methylthiotransferase
LAEETKRTALGSLHLVSLGCPKNRLDSEVMLGLAERVGYRHTEDPAQADVIVINTCSFVQAARAESIQVILELAEHKRAGRCQKLVVTGCLSQRYPAELAAELPEVDHFLGTSDVVLLERVLTRATERVQVGSAGRWIMSAKSPRRLSTRGGSAYLKLSEGCSRHCSFCAIPLIRGRQRSRSVADLVREAKNLIAAGVREINLVAQDSTAYGRDRPERASLAELVWRIAELPGIHWVRIHYLYPSGIDDRLIELWAEHPRVVPYVDVPLQHVTDGMLGKMRRGHDGRYLRRLVERLRHRIPELTLRTAFIVGHPGESQQDFLDLYRFVEAAEFDRIGVFAYSREPETHSARLEPGVPARVVQERARKLGALARQILRRKNRALVGGEVEVLVEGPSEESEWVMVGRHAGQAPEIDGNVVLSGGEARAGEFRRVRIVRVADSDLLGDLGQEARTSLPMASGRRAG